MRDDAIQTETQRSASLAMTRAGRVSHGRIALPRPPGIRNIRLAGRVAELLEDWRHFVRRDGWRSALPMVGQEILGLPYRRLQFVVMSRSLLEPLPEWRPKTPLDIRSFDWTDLEAVGRINRPSEARLCARRLTQGYEGIVATHEGEVVGYTFHYVYAGEKPALEDVELPMEEGDVLLADVYTAPHFRGRGVQTALTLNQMRILRDLGFWTALVYIEVHNTSIIGWRKLGPPRQRGYIDFRRVGPWRRSRFVETSEHPAGGVQSAVAGPQ